MVDGLSRIFIFQDLMEKVKFSDQRQSQKDSKPSSR